MFKIDLLYQFWNTTAGAEKQLMQWLGELGVDVSKPLEPPPLQLITAQHSMQTDTLILKQEKHDPGDVPNIEDTTPQGYMPSSHVYGNYNSFISNQNITSNNVPVATTTVS